MKLLQGPTLWLLVISHSFAGCALLNKAEPLTPRDRFWAFSHTADDQHQGHLAAFETLQLIGAATSVDDKAPPYAGSHRLISSAATGDGHGSTQAGGSSPQENGAYVFAPVWQQLYVAP